MAVALGIVTGRRMVETFSTGLFLRIGGTKRACLFTGQAKKMGTSVALRIPLLADIDLIIEALDRLHELKPCRAHIFEGICPTEDSNDSEVRSSRSVEVSRSTSTNRVRFGYNRAR